MSFYTDFADAYEAIFPFREAVHAFLDGMLPAAAGRVLDVGCGPGRYCGRFADEGRAAVGIDPDAAMISTARRDYPGALFRELDMVRIGELAAEGPFDLAYCVGNVLAHLPRRDLPDFLAALAGLAAPGGVWVFQTVNWDLILDRGGWDFPDRSLPDGTVFRREYREVGPGSVIFATGLERDGATLFSGETTLHPVRAVELEAVHRDGGWRCETMAGDFDGAAFDPAASPAMIGVFRRG